MERSNAWIIMNDGEPLAVSFERADIEELFMDLVVEAQFDTFCWNWLYFQDALELCLKYSRNDGGYWITNVYGWR